MKRKILISVSICLSIVLMFLVFSYIYINGYRFESDIECVNYNMPYISQYSKTIYKYENDDCEILIYNSNDGNIFELTMIKKTINDNVKYKFHSQNATSLPTSNYEWTEVNEDVKYIYLDLYEDIENIDCGGYQPVSEKIEYTYQNGEKDSCWIFVIDKTQ